MSHLLTLVAGLSAGRISAELANRLRRSMSAFGESGEPRWLEPGRALELPWDGVDDPDRAARAVAELLAGEPLDWVVMPRESRRKRLLVADMESTIIENELLPELADLAGHGETVAAITRRAMGGRMDFDSSLLERVGLLRGLPADSLRRVAENIRYTAGARCLVATMKASGARTALVSSGFRCFSEIVAAELGFDTCHANELVVEDGALTGDVERPILNGDSKRAILEELCARWKLRPEEAVAVGDGANDLGMLGSAGMGVAFHASAAVAERVPVRVEHGDLTAVLYFQGYGRGELVE